jgi:hypothetical protein
MLENIQASTDGQKDKRNEYSRKWSSTGFKKTNAIPWVELEDIIQCEMSQTQKEN